MNKIFFYDLDINSRLNKKREIKNFLLSIFERETKELDQLNIIFCTDEYLLRLNREYLNHDYYTDTLSFILSIPQQPVLGEAYLSIDRIKANAKQRNFSYQNELLRVIIHSCLHLCDYSDKTKVAKMKMENLQESYLKRWNVSRETQIGG